MKYDNSGTISKNNEKEKPEQPDIRGKCTVAGVEYWVSGWQKKGEYGTFYSLAFMLKEEKKKSDDGGLAAMDDDIPFMRLTHEYHY